MKGLGKNVDEIHDVSSIACQNYGQVNWLDWTNCFYLDDIAVFKFYLAEDKTNHPDWCTLLLPDEIERGRRYHRRADQLRSFYTRSLLRILVGRYTNQDPLIIRLTVGSKNKPELSDNPGWHVNATHSGNWILLIIGKCHVGIDVEEIKPDFNFTDLIPLSFSPEERQYIGANGKSRVRFYELWTRKEAFVKAIGSGIDEAFPQIPALTGSHTWQATQLGAAGAWIIDSFYVAEGYPAAIAGNYSFRHLHFYTLDHRIFTSLDLRYA